MRGDVAEKQTPVLFHFTRWGCNLYDGIFQAPSGFLEGFKDLKNSLEV